MEGATKRQCFVFTVKRPIAAVAARELAGAHSVEATHTALRAPRPTVVYLVIVVGHTHSEAADSVGCRAFAVLAEHWF